MWKRSERTTCFVTARAFYSEHAKVALPIMILGYIATMTAVSRLVKENIAHTSNLGRYAHTHAHAYTDLKLVGWAKVHRRKDPRAVVTVRTLCVCYYRLSFGVVIYSDVTARCCPAFYS